MTTQVPAPGRDELIELSHSARGLQSGALSLRILTYIVTVVGILAGIGLATESDSDGSHPVFGLGLGLIVAALLQGSLLLVISTIARTYAKDRLFFVACNRYERGY